jgi:hypothetical protein
MRPRCEGTEGVFGGAEAGPERASVRSGQSRWIRHLPRRTPKVDDQIVRSAVREAGQVGALMLTASSALVKGMNLLDSR